MTLSLSLTPVAGGQAHALLDGQLLSGFDPRTLLTEHPLHLDAHRYVAPDEYGRRLLAALGGPKLLERLAALPRAPHPESALVLRVDDPQLAAIPWEYLHTGAAFVAFEHFLLREVAVEPALLPPPPDPARPWRLVVMASDPLLQELRDDKGLLKGHAPLPRLRVANELDALRDGLRKQQPPAPLRWQRIAPARAALIELASPEPILFHYTGHGSVQDGRPVLCFDDGAGTMRPQPVGDLATDLRGRTYFAFLNACRTADSAEPGANLALTLVRDGIPAVLGMQTRIADAGAALLAETFYTQLAAGASLEEALYRARLRLADGFRADPAMWGIPALYRAAGYRLPSQTYAGPPPPPIEPPAPRTESLQAPARLLGRAVELTELMRLFVFEGKRVITVRGPGGMGKTALVHELAARLRFHFRDGIFAITLALAGEQAGLSAAALRAELARRLELRHPAFDDPAAAEEQEQALVGAVHGRRVLLIFDNYETVLWRLGKDADALDAAPADRAAQADLYARYEAGLALLLQRLGQDHADHAEALVYQHRLTELIAEARRYGDTDTLRNERNKVVDQLNRLTLANFNQSFEDLCGPATPTPQSPISNLQSQRIEADAIQRLVRRLANDGTCLLFTTRQSPVDLAEEVCYPPASQREQLGGLDEASAIALFRQRAGGRPHTEALPGQVARALGYGPLAIQLAASRWAGSQQTESEFLANLHDDLLKAEQAGVPFHQRSVLVNVGLSFDALNDELQGALCELTLVANPIITPLHAAVVWGLEDEQQWFADQAHARLEQLQERSLLQGVEERDEERDRAMAYTFQPVIAQVVRARAETRDLGAARERYAAWASQMIDRAFGEGGMDYSEEVARATQFYLADLVAALPHRLAERRGWDAWQAATILRKFGHIAEATQVLDMAEQTAQETADRSLAARVHAERANQAELRGDLGQALEGFNAALALTEEIDEQQSRATILHEMAGVMVTRGDLDGAMLLYQQSLQIIEALGNVQGKSATWNEMANVLVTRGDLDGATQLYQQSLQMFEALGNVQGKSTTLHQMANVLVKRGDLDGATQLYQQSLQMFEALGDVQGKSTTLHQMANVLVTRGDLDGAMLLYQQSLQLKETLGDVQGKSGALHAMANVLVTRGDLDGAMLLYQQSLQSYEALGDVQGKSKTLHQMALVLKTRGDLDDAMLLYQQSFQLKEALGDVQGKGVTLANMARILMEKGDLNAAQQYYEQSLAISEALSDIWGQANVLRMLALLLVQKGERDQAVAGLRRSLSIFERLGATREITITQQFLERLTPTSEEEIDDTPAHLAGRLVALTTAALRGNQPAEQVRGALQAAAAPALAAYIAALAEALERTPGATARLLAAARAILAGDADQWAYGDALAGVGNVAALLDDEDTERAARGESIAAFRRAPQDERTRESLRSAILSLAVLHYNNDDYAAALPLMEEALALTPPGQDDPDLRAAIEVARRRVAGLPPPSLRDSIAAWRDGPRDEDGLAALLNEVCNRIIVSIREATADERQALADDLGLLRAARPLPLAGANEFLHTLQLRLRDEPGMAERAAGIAAGLPGMFQGALGAIERAIAGEAIEEEPAEADEAEEAEAAALAGQLATLLDAAPPECREALAAALAQVVPIVGAAATALANPQITAQERANFAARLDELATQAAAGGQPGSPWLHAATALRALGALLRGGAPDLDGLAEPFRTLLAPLTGDKVTR